MSASTATQGISETGHQTGGSWTYGLWWLSPAGVVLQWSPPPFSWRSQPRDPEYVDKWRTAKALQAGFVWMIAVGVAIFVLASLIPMLLTHRPVAVVLAGMVLPSVPGPPPGGNLAVPRDDGGLCRAGRGGLRPRSPPQDFLAVLLTQDNLSGDLKGLFAPIAGVTSFTQIGIGYVVVATHLLLRGDRRSHLPHSPDRRSGPCVPAAFFLSERLALLEADHPDGGYPRHAAPGKRRSVHAR